MSTVPAGGSLEVDQRLIPLPSADPQRPQGTAPTALVRKSFSYPAGDNTNTTIRVEVRVGVPVL